LWAVQVAGQLQHALLAARRGHDLDADSQTEDYSQGVARLAAQRSRKTAKPCVIQGDALPQKFIPKLIKLYQPGRFPFDRLVKFYAFVQINQAVADSKRGSTIKPVLLMSQEAPAP